MTSDTPLGRLRPVLRTLLPALLYAAGMELVLARVLAPRSGLFLTPGQRPHPLWGTLLAQVDATLFHFALLLSVLVVILLGLASLSRSGRGGTAPWVGPGLVLLGVWSLARFVMDTPALSLAYQFLSLGLALGILFGLFTCATRNATRTFAVLAGALLTCSTLVVVSRMLVRTGGTALPVASAAGRGAELLALTCGLLTPALLPWHRQEHDEQEGFAPVVLAAVAAATLLLLFHGAPLNDAAPHSWSLGWSWQLPLPDELRPLVYAGVLFVFCFALFRALWVPRWRLRGYGLAFLFLAGLHHSLSYQHLLALMGLLLLADGEDPAHPASS